MKVAKFVTRKYFDSAPDRFSVFFSDFTFSSDII